VQCCCHVPGDAVAAFADAVATSVSYQCATSQSVTKCVEARTRYFFPRSPLQCVQRHVTLSSGTGFAISSGNDFADSVYLNLNNGEKREH
jgi:hypothetical protein